jgi:cyclophilin family peptidyl-prolyl cis-trans isomerase
LAALALLALTACQQRVPPQASPAGAQGTAAPPVAVATASPSAVSTPGASPSGSPALAGTPNASPAAPASATPPAQPGKPLQNALKPLPDKTGRFPVLTRKSTIRMATSMGDVTIEIYPEAAPNACQRFLELIESGFYDNTPFSRVVKQPAPFVAQFGINWRKPHSDWENKEFKDDPSYFALERGTLAFAKGGIDHNSTQVFINLRDNNQLAAPSMNFTAFGKVVKGMDVVDSFPSVGEPDSGLDQYRLWTDGQNYLDSLNVKPAMIEKMTVVKP